MLVERGKDLNDALDYLTSMKDIVLVTADSVRRDYVSHMDFLSTNFHVTSGITCSQYTRTSLGGLLSSSYEAPLREGTVSPTVQEVLQETGYTTIGLSPNPNTSAHFGFDRGFDQFESFVRTGSRGTRLSWLRKKLSEYDVLYRIYHRLYPPTAKHDARPSDRAVIDRAIERYNAASSPRFLWVHLMGTHRPYGRGDQAVSDDVDRTALFSPDRLTDAEREEILAKYRASLRRADDQIKRLLSKLEGDSLFAFTSDHGESLGEDGYFFHAPQRRSVDPVITRVPLAFDEIEPTKPWASLVDVAPTLLSAAGVDPPDDWHGSPLQDGGSDTAVTIAPWRERATVAWTDDRKRIVARDARVTLTEDEETKLEGGNVPEEIRGQLRDLGYTA